MILNKHFINKKRTFYYFGFSWIWMEADPQKAYVIDAWGFSIRWPQTLKGKEGVVLKGLYYKKEVQI